MSHHKLWQPRYTRLVAEKSSCQCGRNVTLVCPNDETLPTEFPSFYICWACRNISQVAVGPIEEEKQ